MTIQVSIHEGPLAPTEFPQTLTEEGAVLVFQGVVRPLEQGQPIAGLHYEVYSPMAENLLYKLAQKAIDLFRVTRVWVEHSRGFVPAGECSFRLGITGLHRQEVFEAAQWFIDRLKEDVPIWKRPVPQEGRP